MGNSKLNKAKYKVNQGNPQYQYKLGAEKIEGSPVEKEWGGLVDEKLGMSQQHVLTARKVSHILVCGDSVPLLCSAETLPGGVLHLALRSPVQDRNGPVKAGTEEGYKK